MSLFEAARMAVHGVLANRLRSFLTLLGISIGVASMELATPVWISATGFNCLTLAALISVSGEKR